MNPAEQHAVVYGIVSQYRRMELATDAAHRHVVYVELLGPDLEPIGVSSDPLGVALALMDGDEQRRIFGPGGLTGTLMREVDIGKTRKARVFIVHDGRRIYAPIVGRDFKEGEVQHG